MASRGDEPSIVAGVKQDFESLLKSFAELNTVRFEEFAAVWRKHKMTLLCAGRLTEADTREFMNEVFKIALQFNLPSYTLQSRIGALYLLYSLYFTQPCMPKVLIRLTYGEWQEMLNFQATLADQGHLDASYVFLKLYQDKAFLFVALKNEVIKGGNREMEAPPEDSELKRNESRISSIFDQEALKQLTDLQMHYTLAKTHLAGPGATRPERSLSMTHGQLVPNIVKTMDAFYKKTKGAGPNSQATQQGHRKISMLTSRHQAEEQEDSDTDAASSKARRRKRKVVFQQDSDEEEEEEEQQQQEQEQPIPHFVLSMPTLDSSDEDAGDEHNKDNDGEPLVTVKKGGQGGGGGRGRKPGKGKGRGKGRGKSKAKRT